MNCDAKILVWTSWIAHDGIPGVAECARSYGHSGFHDGLLDHDIPTTNGPGRPNFNWAEDDRRNFRGELEMCGWHPPHLVGMTELAPDTPGHCTLPKRHRGHHAP